MIIYGGDIRIDGGSADIYVLNVNKTDGSSADVYALNVNNRHARKKWKVCSKLILKRPELHH